MDRDLAADARAIIDANLYMVLGTADAAGEPWVSPVYFAPVGHQELLWVSRPGARHSRNIGVRPEVSIVVFDSSVPIGRGQGVYLSAVAREVSGDEIDPAIAVFSARSLGHGGVAWTPDDVRASSHLRLYRATLLAHFILDEHDQRLPFTPD